MNKLYSIDYEKDCYIDSNDLDDIEHDVDKEADIIIDKSLECADKISECINEIPYTKIAENSIDYDLHKKNNVVPVKGNVKVFISNDKALNDIDELLEKRGFIVSQPELITDIS